MANLAAVQPPQQPKEMTIADMVSQAYKGVHDLRERMLLLSSRAGVCDSAATEPPQPCALPAPPLREMTQDLLKLISSAHDAMDTLNRIA